jgi:hypothetical protein
MFDLAETFGMPVGQLERVITESELNEWGARPRPVGLRRIEKMLAQVCWMIGRATGSEAEFDDYDMFLPEHIRAANEALNEPQSAAEDLSAMTGLGVTVLKVGA